VILTGMVTSGCVRSTAIDAFSYNYRVIIPQECVADRGQTSHKVALFDLHMKYADVVPMAETMEYLRKLAPVEAVR
jgi:nicotinamidase-related amidase